MNIEELNESSSWISINALRNAADIKKSIKLGMHRKSASALPNLPPKSAKPSPEVTKVVNIIPKSNHQRFNTASLENYQINLSPEVSFSEPEKKYNQIFSKLNEEIVILSEQLKQANSTISSLTIKLNESNNKHSFHIQALQERHEQKLKRNQHENELILSSIKASHKQELENTRTFFQQELSKQQESFQNYYKSQEQNFFDELENKNKKHYQQIAIQKQHFIEIITNLKKQFDEELEFIQNKYKNKIELLKDIQERNRSSERGFEEEGSTIIELDLEKSKNKDHLEPHGECNSLNSSQDKKYKQSANDHRSFDSIIMNLLNQLK